MIKYDPVTRCIHVVQAFAISCHKVFTSSSSSSSSSSSWPSDSFGLLQRGGRGASIYMVATGMVPRQQQMTSTRSWAGRWSLVSWLENVSCTGMLFAGEAFGKICEAFGIVGPDPSWDIENVTWTKNNMSLILCMSYVCLMCVCVVLVCLYVLCMSYNVNRATTQNWKMLTNNVFRH